MNDHVLGFIPSCNKDADRVSILHRGTKDSCEGHLAKLFHMPVDWLPEFEIVTCQSCEKDAPTNCTFPCLSEIYDPLPYPSTIYAFNFPVSVYHEAGISLKHLTSCKHKTYPTFWIIEIPHHVSSNQVCDMLGEALL